MVVEQIPCGMTNKEIYASVDWGIEYRKDVDISLWDPGSLNKIIDIVAHISYRVVHDDTMVCSGIQQYTMMYGGVRWVFGMFLPRIPPYMDFRNIIEFGSPNIDDWMDEIHGEEYSSKIDLRLGYQLGVPGEKDVDWERGSDGDDQSGAMSVWWYLFGISLGPCDYIV
jgi:hypothetical protein